MSAIDLPAITWKEFNVLHDEAKSENSDKDFPLPFDWGDLTMVDMGSKDTAGQTGECHCGALSGTTIGRRWTRSADGIL